MAGLHRLSVALLALLAVVSCSEGVSGESSDLPLILRGTASQPGQDYTQISRFPFDADIDALMREYRITDSENADAARRTGGDIRWWVVIPPIQRSAGFQLHVTLEQQTARACLAPPQGAAAAAMTASAFLVTLPEQVGAIDWDGSC